jgi:aminopeptidase YwaD
MAHRKVSPSPAALYVEIFCNERSAAISTTLAQLCILPPMKQLLTVILLAGICTAQHLVTKETFDAIANEYSGERAQENIRAIVEYSRIQGSPMMANVASDVVLAKLKANGIESKVEQWTSDGKTMYGTYTSPIGWDMRGGELWIESAAGEKNFQPVRLCRYADVPMCVATMSKEGEWAGELVEVGKGTSAKDYEGKDVNGKVALASGYAADVVREAVLKHGAVGVVIYPPADDRPEHPDMVRYNALWPKTEEVEKTRGGFMISLNQYANLKSLMANGPVGVHGKIDATLGPGKLTHVHAYIRGTEHPQQEILITAHLDHPKWSANDNASGAASLIEMARTLNALIAAKKIPQPLRTIHFMWVSEYYGTLAYATNHKETRRCGDWDDPRGVPKWDANAKQPCTVADINMDMVGEDTQKTNGRFYFTRTPDSVPSFLNALLEDVMQQTRDARLFAGGAGTHNYWQPEVTPLALGSDHEIFLGLGIPATMFGHEPDWTHHTSEDTVDKTDASELLRVGVMASAASIQMAIANKSDWERIGLVGAIGERTRINEVSKEIATLTGRDEPSFREGGAILQHIGGLGETHTIKGDYPQVVDWRGPTEKTIGPRRLVLLPINSKELFADLVGDDKQWWDAQDERFAPPEGDLLPLGATRDKLVWETINFMDGHRSTAEIADLLSAEYLVDIDQAWVDRLVKILEAKKLAALK